MKPREIELLIIALTGACNFDCTYCYASKQTQSAMTSMVMKKAIGLLQGNRRRATVQFTGGEPLLNYPLLVEAVTEIERLGVPVQMQIQTNGSLITPEIAAFLRNHHVAVGISLDGLPSVNDVLRPAKDGTSSTAKIVQGIRTLADAGVLVGLTCVVTKDNVQHLEELIDFAYYMGNIRQVGFNLLRPQGRADSEAAASPAEVAERMQAVLRYNKEMAQLTGVEILVSQVERTCRLQNGFRPFSHCYALHKNGLYVDPQGDLYACASLSGVQEYLLGNIDDGVDEEREAALLAKLETVVAYCSQCKDIELCGGACYSRSDEAGRVTPTECAFKRACIDFYKREYGDETGKLSI